MRVKVWLRIVLIVILLTVLLARWLKRAMPDLEFDWAGQLAISIATVVIGLYRIRGQQTLRVRHRPESERGGDGVFCAPDNSELPVEEKR